MRREDDGRSAPRWRAILEARWRVRLRYCAGCAGTATQLRTTDLRATDSLTTGADAAGAGTMGAGAGRR
jgi:hypothetical protein